MTSQFFNSLIKLVFLPIVGLSLSGQGTVALAQSIDIKVIDTDQKTISGTLDLWTEKSITIKDFNQSRKSVLTERIAQVLFPASSAKLKRAAAKVYLFNGTILVANQVELTERKAEIQLLTGKMISLNRKRILSIQFLEIEQEPDLKAEFHEIAMQEGIDEDGLVLIRDQQLNLVEGIVKSLSDRTIQFSIGERTAPIPVDKIKGIVFYQATLQHSDELNTSISLELNDGSIIFGSKLKPNLDGLEIQLDSGESFRFQFTDIREILRSAENSVPLSRLKPTTNQWFPLLVVPKIETKLRKFRLAKANQAYSGAPLSLRIRDESNSIPMTRIQTFEHGFCISGGGKLTFNLDRRYSSLSGQIGFDPEANENGHVQVKILLDGKTGFRQEIIARDLIRPINVQLETVDSDRLTFEIDYCDGRSIGDVLHLVNFRLTPK
ncbi:MAG: NPCBM/NEW2 domain-containing protein [Planctomycetota bacterium]